MAEQINTEFKSVGSGGGLVNVRQGQFDVRIRQRQEIRLFALNEVWWIVGALIGDVFEETRHLLDDGLGIGITLGVVGELVVAGNCSNSKRVCCAACIGLDVPPGRVLVDGAWDLVDVKQLAGFRISLAKDIDSESFHHRDGHVDVRLRNDLSASELQYYRLWSLRSAEEMREGGTPVIRGSQFRCCLPLWHQLTVQWGATSSSRYR